MKKSFIIFLSAGLIATGSLTSCSKEIGSLNGVSVEEISANPNSAELNSLVTGSEAGMRTQLGVYLDAVGVMGREIYRLSGAEPRYTSELLGKGQLQLSNSVFYLGNPWNARYRVVKDCNILIDAATRSTRVSDKEKKGYTGFGKTIKAYQLLLNLNYTETNGIRVDVADPSKLGPFLTYEQSLTEISKLLDEGKTELAGGTIIFNLSSGFDNGVGDLVKFNRALAARVAAYRKDWNGVLTALSESFYDITGSFSTGYYHVFSTGTNDQTNPSYFPANNT
ncbi:MAG: RagB/SusD family nutrient uptake outer membrane protein, partial [Chitinophagaceae bacterium]|nr:RagB/SusD family nutrient uptake outer membrane protein [Chitinophagaceae bacterium]